ncbi:DUF6343 family protein [Fodinicola acaciae]|uniref:DUF6343 family protein n=1 Tax=Fodinicola acaciae TaxID=2681555 RepID=UPI0013D85783|nr:DUF6343 family protein [Fodinicola acaciae]
MRGRKRSRAEYQRGLPDYHDPTAGIGGAPPAYSALTLRIWLASFGLVVCLGGGIAAVVLHVPAWIAIVLFVFAAIALVDLGWVVHRKLRGEPH